MRNFPIFLIGGSNSFSNCGFAKNWLPFRSSMAVLSPFAKTFILKCENWYLNNGVAVTKDNTCNCFLDLGFTALLDVYYGWEYLYRNNMVQLGNINLTQGSGNYGSPTRSITVTIEFLQYCTLPSFQPMHVHFRATCKKQRPNIRI